MVSGVSDWETTIIYSSFNASGLATAVVISVAGNVSSVELISSPPGSGPLFDAFIRGCTSHDV